jgi:hypothetical protein
MHQMKVEGFSVAKVSATRFSCSPGMPVMRSTSSGVLGDFGADLVHAVDALGDELLVLPAVLEDVPQDAPDHRDVGAGAEADVVGGMGRGAGEARVDDDDVGALLFLAGQDVLQRHRVRLGRVRAHEDHGLRIADVVVAVGLAP